MSNMCVVGKETGNFSLRCQTPLVAPERTIQRVKSAEKTDRVTKTEDESQDAYRPALAVLCGESHIWKKERGYHTILQARCRQPPTTRVNGMRIAWKELGSWTRHTDRRAA